MTSQLADKVERWPLDRLIPHARNARTHSDAQVAQIAGSIAEFGFVNPVLVGDDGIIVAGHGRILTMTKGAIYICMSSSELDVLQKAFREAGGKWSTFVIWAKNTFTLGRSDYQRQYEPILYGWKDGVDHYWCGARDQGDVWFINKPAKNDLHPTMKPIELVERALRNSSKSRDIVLDLFGGSGTTMIAAERSGRRARLVELDPKYVDVIVQRWQSLTGGSATHAATGQKFADSKA